MKTRHDIFDLISISRMYGADSRYVLLGGGNTSRKIGEVMYVKASGCALSDIDETGFVAMSLPKLNAIWDKRYPENSKEREKEILHDMMEARCQGETARPSVEALLHSIIPFTYVVHLHPALVNGLTCSQSGKQSAASLFPDALWIPLVNPGYILAKTVRDALQETGESTLIFLQNHGVFAGADTVGQIEHLYDSIMKKLNRSVVRKPIFTEVKVHAKRVKTVQTAMERFYGGPIKYPMVSNREIASRLVDEKSFYSLSSAYTPDHIVYSGFRPLWIPEKIFEAEQPVEAVLDALRLFEKKHGVTAKIIAVQKTSVFAISEAAMALFLDTVKIAAFTEGFGGPRFMDDEQIEFIRTWEVEQYRANMSGK